jgi:hypothetical protein
MFLVQFDICLLKIALPHFLEIPQPGEPRQERTRDSTKWISNELDQLDQNCQTEHRANQNDWRNSRSISQQGA